MTHYFFRKLQQHNHHLTVLKIWSMSCLISQQQHSHQHFFQRQPLNHLTQHQILERPPFQEQPWFQIMIHWKKMEMKVNWRLLQQLYQQQQRYQQQQYQQQHCQQQVLNHYRVAQRPPPQQQVPPLQPLRRPLQPQLRPQPQRRLPPQRQPRQLQQRRQVPQRLQQGELRPHGE